MRKKLLVLLSLLFLIPTIELVEAKNYKAKKKTYKSYKKRTSKKKKRKRKRRYTAPFPASACHLRAPHDFEIHGIDVSHYQNTIDWSKINHCPKGECSKVTFVFMRSTVGEKVDTKFSTNWQKSKENGLIRGAYHYFKASKDAKTQAFNFIRNVSLAPGDFPPVLDIESNERRSRSEVIRKAKTWINIIEKHYGVKPIIYSSESFYKKYLAGNFPGYTVWIANYNLRSNPKKSLSRKNINWKFWQYTDKGRRHGVSTYVDYNVFHGSFNELIALTLK